MSGRVVAVGSDVREVEPGTYVAAETHVVDHTCRQCERGLYHLCENVRVLGVDRDGSFARYVLLPAENCWRNAPGLSPRSEEHTSELQSQSNLVCRLLLE